MPPKFTHAQLEKAHFRQYKALSKSREITKKWKQRALKAEARMKEYIVVDTKPDYFFSFSGHLLFRRYYSLNGLTAMQVEFIIVIGVVGVFTKKNYALFRRNHLSHAPDKYVDQLEKMHYVTKISLRVNGGRRIGWVLTQRGKDVEADYKKYYDQKMDEIRAGVLTPFIFEDGAHFRKIFVEKKERRAQQGGGTLRHKNAPPIFIDHPELKIEENGRERKTRRNPTK